MADEGKKSLLFITVQDEWESMPRVEAHNWLSKLFRKITKNDNATWEGELRSVQPIPSGIEGCKYKVVLYDVPEELIDSSIIPGLKAEGCLVKKAATSVVEEDRKNAKRKWDNIKSRLDAVGNVEQVQETINKLYDMHGCGGEEEKRQKFSQEAMSVFKTSMVVASSDLKEANGNTNK